MTFKQVIFVVLTIFCISLIFIYWFLPFNSTSFSTGGSPEFNIGNSSSEMQFYPNMRFQDTNISYSIDSGCSLKKNSDMKRAFNYIENLTTLSFYALPFSKAEINVTCDEKSIPSGRGTFVAGEGGPTKIIPGENFNVILGGEILLLRDSKCERPNVEIHELLHVLGFNHSKNSNNIMYPVSDCSQTISEDIVNKINEVYSYPKYPDLKLEKVSAYISGRYLDINLSVSNIGLTDSKKAVLKIYGDGEKIKEINIPEIGISATYALELNNAWIPKRQIKELNISLETSESELSLENNYVTLTSLSS